MKQKPENTLLWAVVTAKHLPLGDVGELLPWPYIASTHETLNAALSDIVQEWGESAPNLKACWPVAVPVSVSPHNNFYIAGQATSTEYLDLICAGKE